MIQVNNVVKTFDGFRALDGLTMKVERGSIYGLVGPNGSGKSTILRHITGVYRPDSGSVSVDGKPVYENPESPHSCCISFFLVFQAQAVFRLMRQKFHLQINPVFWKSSSSVSLLSFKFTNLC